MSQAPDTEPSESEVFKAKYRRIKSVGKGSFGEAILCRSKADGKRYIAKTVETATMSPKEKRDLQNEIRILAAVNHPNIIRYQEHFEDGTVIFIIMEYADGGDLSQKIKDRKKKAPEGVAPELFDPKLVMFWFLQICMALKFLHDKRILHRDLKTANIFLTTKNVVKLGDFGISTVLQNTMACAKTVCGTPYYFSPEICQSRPYNNKSDIWALGVVFYETITLNRPFNAKSLKELLKKILVGQYEPIPEVVPLEIRNLCASLLQISPSHRPSVNRLLEQPYVQQCLRGFSEDLEEQTAKEKADYEAKKVTAGPQGTTAQAQGTAPPQQPVNDVDAKAQFAAMKKMSRDEIRAMAKQPNSAIESEMARQQLNQGQAGANPSGIVEDDSAGIAEVGEAVQAKEVMKAKMKEYQAGSVGPDEEFGDAPAATSVTDEVITLANGATVPARDVRKILETEIGSSLLAGALDYVNDLMSSPHAPSNADIQRELNALLGLKFAHHSNALTKLAVWESKVM